MADGKSAVGTYVAQRLRGITAQGVVVDRLTVPLSEYDHFRLVFLCARLGLSQAHLAAEFLHLAIEDAMGQVRPIVSDVAEILQSSEEQGGGLDPEDIRSRQREFDTAFSEAYRRWLVEGKKPPRATALPGRAAAPEREARRRAADAGGPDRA